MSLAFFRRLYPNYTRGVLHGTSHYPARDRQRNSAGAVRQSPQWLTVRSHLQNGEYFSRRQIPWALSLASVAPMGMVLLSLVVGR